MQTAHTIRTDAGLTTGATKSAAPAYSTPTQILAGETSDSAARTTSQQAQSPSAQTPEAQPARLTRQQLQFLLRVTPAAIESGRQYEIPACVTIAQAILESATPQFGWGSSSLFRLANNPFGIKYCHFGPEPSSSATAAAQQAKPAAASPIPDSKFLIPDDALAKTSTGPSIMSEDYGHFDAETWEIENGQKKYVLAQFQRFPNLTEAFRAHAYLLRGPRYQPAFEVRADWKQFAERLGPKTSQLDRDHCGYSTSPSYSAGLIRLVNLYRLNDPRALQWYSTGEDPGPAEASHLSNGTESLNTGNPARVTGANTILKS